MSNYTTYDIYLSPPALNGSEFQHLKETIESGWLAPVGPALDAFEASIAAYSQSPYVLALQSGTAAIHLALQLAGVGKGDKVVCPTFTFAASVNPIIYQQATPVLIDSENETWGICPNLLASYLEKAKTRGELPKALILVHLFGMPAKTEAIVDLCKKYGVFCIEDAAEAQGSTFHQQALGTLGDIGVYSFNGNKIITTTAGGALLCKTETGRKRALYLATQAKDALWKYHHSEIGYNYRMSNLLAGFGLAQMQGLHDKIEKKRAIHAWYASHLSDVGCFLEESNESFSNRWLSVITLYNPKISIEKLVQEFHQERIEVRPVWNPLHLQKAYAAFPAVLNGTSEQIFKQSLCLPSGVQMTEADLERIEKVLRKNV